MRQETINAFNCQREIVANNRRIAQYRAKGNWVKITELLNRNNYLQQQVDLESQAQKLEAKTANMDKNLRSWAGRTLSMSINCADASLYLLDMFCAYFKDIGFERKEEWELRYKTLEKAIKDFSQFSADMFSGKDRNDNCEDLIRLCDLLCTRFYTDREQVYFRKYQDLANN